MRKEEIVSPHKTNDNITECVMSCLGENLKKLRKKQGLSQQNVADFLFISRSTYTKYEIGAAFTPIPVLIKLAVLYETDVNSLLCFDDFNRRLGEELLAH